MTLVVSGVLMGALLSPTTAIGGVVSPASIGIVVVWTIGVYVINKVRKSPRWSITMEGAHPGRRHRRDPLPAQPHPFASRTTSQVAWIFAGACAVTLGAGVTLEMTGNTLADRAGVNGVIFGATILAGATALPEISSGIAAVRLGDHALALGDIFGGNAFQLCLFLVADLVAGSPVLPTAGSLNAWLASLGVGLTAIFAMGVVIRPLRCRARLGPDSILAVVVFAVGIAGLFVVPSLVVLQSFAASHAFATRFCARVSHASTTASRSSSRSRRARSGIRISTAG